MTRWARTSSIQRHRKVPADATPWSEFSRQFSQKLATRDSPKRNSSIGATSVTKTGKSSGTVKKNLLNTVSRSYLEEIGTPSTSFNVSDSENWVSCEEDFSAEPSRFDTAPQETQVIGSSPIRESSQDATLLPQISTPQHFTKALLKNIKIGQNFDLKLLKQLVRRSSQKKSLKDGFIMLPQKVEKEIVNLKKSLALEKLPKEQIKDIVLKRRNREEKIFYQKFLKKVNNSQEETDGKEKQLERRRLDSKSSLTETLAKIQKVEETLQGKKVKKKAISSAVRNMHKL